MIAIAVAAGALAIRNSIPGAKGGKFKTYAEFRDGSRLAVGSPVVIAGVQVGTIDKLTVDGRLARVDMELQDGLDLPVDSFATRRADSLFGDSYIEIIPPAGGSARPLASGEPITHIVEGGSTDAVLRGIASALPRIDSALRLVHEAAIAGRHWVNGPVDGQLGVITEWLTPGRIDDPLHATDRAMIQLDDRLGGAAEAVARARPEVARSLARIDQAVVGANRRMVEVRTGLVGALRDTRDGLDSIDPQLAQAQDLVAAIDEGRGDDWKGTLGRLTSDPKLGETLDDATSGAREAVANLNRFKSWLGMRLEFNVFSRSVRFYATAELRARADKFYLIELERGPLGAIPNDELSEVAGTAAYTRQQEIHDRVRFTAQFGKQLGPIAVRGGLKDSTFGFGSDAWLLDGRLKLSADLYGAFQATPRLKLVGALAVFRSLYVLAGVDDALNRPGYLSIISGQPGAPNTFDHVRYGRDYFVGSMLVISDADISVLLRVYGALLVGLL